MALVIGTDRSQRKNWERIGRNLGGEPVYVLIKSWLSIKIGLKELPPKRWLPEEDLLVTELVALSFGKLNTKAIEKHVPGRSYHQIYNRWHQCLKYVSPSKGPWTEDEDNLIIRLHSELGSRWSQFRSYLPNRPIDLIRNRFVRHLKPLLERQLAQKKLLSMT